MRRVMMHASWSPLPRRSRLNYVSCSGWKNFKSQISTVKLEFIKKKKVQIITNTITLINYLIEKCYA